MGNLLGQGEFGRVREVIEITDKAGHEGISRLLKQGRNNGSNSFQIRAESCSLHEHEPLMQPFASSKMEDNSNSEGDDSLSIVGERDSSQRSREDESIEFVEIEAARRARKVLKKRCWREGRARYAVKQLKEELLVPADDGDEWHMGTVGAMDLAMEAALLASLSHPNIVKLRATAGIPGRPEYMLVMDRLYTTLDRQIEEWRQEFPKTSAINKLLNGQGNWSLHQSLSSLTMSKGMDMASAEKRSKKAADRLRREVQLLNRLYAAYDVARALRYLHENKIVYRDLKPQNIAFDIRGDVRIFDFGLAKELVEADIVRYPDDYNATGMTGSRRWMSPEVFYSKPYGLSADVYSFGLLLWNLCYLETPYGDNLTLKSHEKKVMVKGQRPKRLRSKAITDNLWAMLSICWATNRSDRPTMDIVCQVLREETSALKAKLELSTGGRVAPSAVAKASEEDPAPNATGVASLSSTDLSRAYTAKTASCSSSASSSQPSSFRRVIKVPVLKLFQRTRCQDFDDPVDVSFHHFGNKTNMNLLKNRAARAHQLGDSWKSLFFSKEFRLRNSDLDERSKYLMQKSINSIAGLQHSSVQLDCSSSSHPHQDNRNAHSFGSLSPRYLFGGGNSANSLGHVQTH